jgi:hypothetical protein
MYTFQLIDGVLSPELLLPIRKVGPHQVDFIICNKNVKLLHSFLPKGDTSNFFVIGVIRHGVFNSRVRKSFNIV